MKSQLSKIFKIVLVILFFTLSKSYAIEDVTEFTDAINEASENFNNISESSTEQSKIIDEAFKEIDKATEYVQEAINNNNVKDAIKTLEFIEKSLADVVNIIPQEFGSDMSKIDTEAMSKEDMDVVNEVTAQMKISKEEKLSEYMSDLIDLNQKGIDTSTISGNLNSLGIKTIQVVINIDKGKNTKGWTKEEWADSYQGTILTSSGSVMATDKEANDEFVDLEQKLQVNNIAILDKRSSLTELQTKIDPLTNQITDLQSQKTNLLAKYNEQILKQSSTVLSNEEINQSKELADQFNNQMSDITNQIKTTEEQSNSLQQQVQGLNLELAGEIGTRTQLEQNINNLNSELLASQNSLSQRELQLDQLRNTDLNLKVNELNSELKSVSRQRDFIETDFERSIDLEVEALKRYHSALGDTAEERGFAMREVDVILDSDPRKARAFEMEKYATYAGFSKDQIQNGIDAVNSDNWDTQKEVFKDITKALSKNPNWQVNVPSNAEFNVMMEEEKAIQAAVFQSIELGKVKDQVQNLINEKTKDIQPLAALNLQTIKSASTWEGMAEHVPLTNEVNKILSSTDYNIKQNELKTLKKDFEETSQWLSQAGVLRYSTTFTSEMESEYSQKYYENLNLQRKYFPLSSELSQIEYKVKRQARVNLTKIVEEAKIEYNSIVEEETKVLKELQSKVANTLKEVPTFEANADLVSDLDPAMLRAKLTDITSGNNNDVEALKAARKAMAEMGDKPVTEFMTGPYWEMTNVKAAAIVRSKKYDYIDDYEYMNAYYRDPLDLNSSQRTEVESELKNVLGNNNMKLQAINTKINSLNNELSLTKEQSQNLTAEISNLENEVSSLKTSETEIQNQISDLSNQFNSKESLITEKTQNLASLKEQLNPISDKMSDLQGQRAELDTKLSNQLNTITNQIEGQGQGTDEANALKAQFESQIAQLDNQLKDYENQSVEISGQLTSLTNDLGALETETPEIINQIKSLNQDLVDFNNIKANLAIVTAKKLGLIINEQAIQSVKIVDGKAIVALKGTDLFKVVDEGFLLNDAENLLDPISDFSINSKIYSADALNQDLITPEFLEASKSISFENKLDVIAETSALNKVGATTEQSAAYATAKAARFAARADWDKAMKSGNEAAKQATQAAFMAARDAEQVAGQAAVAAAAAVSAASTAASTAASAASSAASTASSAAQDVASVAQEAAQEVSAAAQEVAQEVAAVAQEAAADIKETVASVKEAQEAAMGALKELEGLPGATGFHSQEVQAAIAQLQSEMSGEEFSYMGESSYADAMKEIERMEESGKSVVECLSNKNGGKGEGC
jgi:uncharacterized coiled-coil DUF342 family protein